MHDEFQTQQYWRNMKKTELKQIIKEEFEKVLNENESYSYDELPGYKYYKIPEYKDLPETEREAQLAAKPIFIFLPSLNLSIEQMEGINNKEDIKKYVEKYKEKFGVEPEFFEDKNYSGYATPERFFYNVKGGRGISSDIKIDTTGD